MASFETFKTKVRKAFHFFDLNKDNWVTREELVAVADKISSLSNANDTEREFTRKQWAKWCDFILPEGKIAEEEFLKREEEMFKKCSEIFKKENASTYENLFDRVDSNKDGFISPEELRLYYKAFGYGEDYDINKVFQSLDTNKDGLVSREEFIQAGAIYWSNTPGYEYFYDPTKKEDNSH